MMLESSAHMIQSAIPYQGLNLISEDSLVHIIGANSNEQSYLPKLLRSSGFQSNFYPSRQDFLTRAQSSRAQSSHECFILLSAVEDVSDTHQLIHDLFALPHPNAVICFSHTHPPASLVVDSIKAGATDFIDTPFTKDDLLSSLQRSQQIVKRQALLNIKKFDILSRLSRLTVRENEILFEMRSGHPNKIIAYHLGISQRTVENHRANIMTKMGASNLAALMNMLTLTHGE